MHYCRVAVKYPGKEGILTYKVGEHVVKRGDLVKVPLGRRKVEGCVVASQLSEDDVREEIAGFQIKEVEEVLPEVMSLTDSELSLYEWMAKYYHYNLGMVIFESLPEIMKRPKKIDLKNGVGKTLPHDLGELQAPIYKDIAARLDKGFDRFYIHGVTGSGKTLVYLNLIRDTLARGKSVLFLLPEINLTPQFTETFLDYVDCPILSYHSGISNSEKYIAWKFLKESPNPVIIMGVRSSVFLPAQNLGLVIVDEEHDSSFKQSDRCPYNGRDVAIKKAQLANCPVVMGSATPSVENYFSFTHNKNLQNHYFTMKERIAGNFPQIELLDARFGGKKLSVDELSLWPFEQRSIDLIKTALDSGEQVLVFVNRLGFANYVQCRACGHKFEDPNTGVALRYFKNKGILSSAHSDFEIPMPEICPSCGNMNLLQKGFGTERLQEVLEQVFPDKRIDRFDRDEIKTLNALTEKLDAFHRGDIDVFVGTQMLSKGHNFKKVNLVLVLGVDSMMNFPDFRAIERTYQTITQILGRAGRYSEEAKVVIQTLVPENKLFSTIKEHSFNGFYEDEISIREFSGFPPFSKLAVIHFNGRFRDKLIEHSVSVANGIKEFCAKNSFKVDVLGPAPASIERRSGQFTWTILLRAEDVAHLHTTLNFFEKNYNRISGISFKIDVDPYHTL